jgi:nucleoside transporter
MKRLESRKESWEDRKSTFRLFWLSIFPTIFYLHDMNKNNQILLSIMMFLQFFIWGAWYGQMSKYLFTNLNASGSQVGNAYSAFSIAMIAAPFFIGMIADRYFAAQKVLGALNILGAIVLFFLIREKSAAHFFWWILAYCLTFAPTISLTSSISMAHMSDPARQFPIIRVMGTIAWFVVTNFVGFLGVGDKSTIFYISMIVSLILGAYAFFLPDTPPKATDKPTFLKIIGADAFVMFKDRSFLIFFISSILICIPLSFYYAMANPSLTDSGMTNVENKMSLGLLSEFLFMLAIPFAMRRFGVKWIMIVGLIGWIVRFFLFSNGNGTSGLWMLYLAILLHGLCFDFFFVSGQIYTDAKAGEKIKSQAQGLISLATYGIGMYIGSVLAGLVTEKYTVDGIKNWAAIWMVPAGIAAVVLVLFLLFFKDNTRNLIPAKNSTI